MESKLSTVEALQAVKRNSGKTYGQIAEETGLTNVYVAQLLRRQAQLKPDTAPLLREALPGLSEGHLDEMMQPPLRSYDPRLIQEPTIYRLNEAVMHFGESIKEIINEEFGDGMFKLPKLLWVVVLLTFIMYNSGDGLNKKVNLSFKLQYLINMIYLTSSFPFFLKKKSFTGSGNLTSSMSAIDFYCSVDKIKGFDGKDRVVLTFDGKYLPHTEHRTEHMVSRTRKIENQVNESKKGQS